MGWDHLCMGNAGHPKALMQYILQENASLAYLEYLVHQFERKTWPKDLAISKLSIDDTDIFTVDTDSLPDNWKSVRYIAQTQIVGDKYFSEEKLAIRLPSVIVEDECNVIINPTHKNFSTSVQLQKVEPLDLDQRFKQS